MVCVHHLPKHSFIWLVFRVESVPVLLSEPQQKAEEFIDLLLVAAGDFFFQLFISIGLIAFKENGCFHFLIDLHSQQSVSLVKITQ